MTSVPRCLNADTPPHPHSQSPAGIPQPTPALSWAWTFIARREVSAYMRGMGRLKSSLYGDGEVGERWLQPWFPLLLDPRF